MKCQGIIFKIITMARVSYIAPISEIVGSIGGFTFQRNRSGTIIRSRPSTYKSSTIKQTAAQQLFIHYLQLWQGLSQANKDLWDAFAIAHTKDNSFGQTKTLTGLNWFQSINYYRELLRLSVLSSPPAYLLPAAVPAYSFNVDETTLEIDFSLPWDPPDCALLIRLTQPVNRNTESLQRELRLVKILTEGEYSSMDLLSDWENYFDIPYPPSSETSNFTLGVMVQSLRKASGICSVGRIELSKLDLPAEGIGFWIIEDDFIVQ